MVTVEPEAVTVEWIYVDTVKSKTFTAAVGKRLRVAHSSNGRTEAFAEL